MIPIVPVSPPLRPMQTFPVPVELDGREILFNIKRLDLDTFEEFRLQFQDYGGTSRGAQPPAPLSREEERERRAWLKEQIIAFVTIAPGQIENPDPEDGGEFLTTGAQLLRWYGGREELIIFLLAAIYGENTVSEGKKGTFRSRLASPNGSPAVPLQEDAGPRPAAIVAAVEPSGTVSREDATDTLDRESSGTTDPSS